MKKILTLIYLTALPLFMLAQDEPALELNSVVLSKVT